jgi:hypothetical protein
VEIAAATHKEKPISYHAVERLTVLTRPLQGLKTGTAQSKSPGTLPGLLLTIDVLFLTKGLVHEGYGLQPVHIIPQNQRAFRP